MPAEPHNRRLEIVVVTLLLASAWCQIGIGARFCPLSGQQLGTALPVPTFALLLALLLLVRIKSIPLPVLSRSQCLMLVCAGIGMLGLHRQQLPGGIKQLLQLGLFIGVTPWFFCSYVNLSLKTLRSILAGLCLLLMLLAVTGMHDTALLQLSGAKYAVFLLISFPFLLVAIRDYPLWLILFIGTGASLIAGMTITHAGLLLAWMVAVVVSCALLQKPSLSAATLFIVVAAIASIAPVHASSPWQQLHPRHSQQQHIKRTYIEAIAALRAPRYLPVGGGLGQYNRSINYLRQFIDPLPHPDDQTVPRDSTNQYLLLLAEAGLPAATAFFLLLLAAYATPLYNLKRQPMAVAAEAMAVIAALAGLTIAAGFCVVLSRGTELWLGMLLGLSLRFLPPPSVASLALRYGAVAGGIIATLTISFVVNNSSSTPMSVSATNHALRRLTSAGDRVGALAIIELADPLLPDSSIAAGSGRVLAVSATVVQEPFRILAELDASAGQALVIPVGAGKGKGLARYQINIAQPGSYRLHARVYWADGCSNSFAFEIAESTVVLTSETYGRWHVVESPRQLELERGELEVTIHNLEDGVRLDYWQLRRVEKALP